MDFLQFIGTISPTLAPTLLISYVSIRLILEFLKERREQQEQFRTERKEWRDSYEALLKESRREHDDDTKTYQGLMGQTIALERDISHQLHNLKNEVQKALLELGRRGGLGND